MENRIGRMTFVKITIASALICRIMALADVGFTVVLARITIAAAVATVIVATVRRLHDLGRTGWWIVLTILPVIESVVTWAIIIRTGQQHDVTLIGVCLAFLVWGLIGWGWLAARKGDQRINDYGPPPANTKHRKMAQKDTETIGANQRIAFGQPSDV